MTAMNELAFYTLAGQPKSPRELIDEIRTGEALGLGPDDRIFTTSRLFFAYALGNCLFPGLKLGATCVIDDEWPDSARVAASDPMIGSSSAGRGDSNNAIRQSLAKY